MPKLLVLGAGAYLAPALRAIRQAGYKVLAVDRDPNAPGKVEADDFRPIDIKDIDSLSAWAAEAGVDGVMPLNDFGTPAAAAVASRLGLLGNSFDCARTANDKGLMRECWKQAGLSIPDFVVVDSADAAAAACGSVGFPCIVKPALSGGGGRGISVVREPAEVAWAVEFARPHALNGRFVVERFVEGLELTVEVASIDGKHITLARSDKEKPPLRTRVATSLNYPAAISKNQAQKIDLLVHAALDAIDFRYGISHTEVLLDSLSGDPVLVETGARPGGGHIFHTLIKAVSGINGPKLNADILSGRLDCLPQPQAWGGVYRFITAQPGKLIGIQGVETARTMPGILDVGVTAKLGQQVGILNNSFDRPGYIVSQGRTRDAAIAAADAAQSMIRLFVEQSR